MLEKASFTGQPSTMGRYTVALLSVAAALFVHWMLDPALREHLGFVTVYGGVAFAVWYGRWKPALAAAILGWLGASYFFFIPGHVIAGDTKTLARLAGYIFSCVIIIGFGELLHRTRDRAEAERDERKLAQQAEARQRELLTTSLKSIGDAVILTDAQGRVTFLNAEAERLTAWTSAEALGRPLPEVFRIANEHTRQTVENPVEKVVRLGSVVGLANHTILLTKDGREIPIDDSAAPIREPGGPLFGIVLVFRDFSERKKAQEADARLAAIVAHSGDAIIAKDLKGIVRSWNAGAERLFGYRPEEIVGKPVTILFPQDRLEEEDHILDNLRQGRPVERFETVRVAKDGRHIPVLASISPI
ncbi:MAG TPA: PAS domain S-box protein, partial [Verrucomicrobiae bacterium]|nr:PAS domain S-box protein [Verrucomicrobiae bacterium]